MIFIGIFFIIISFFIFYKRFGLIIFGKKADGKIVGYADCTRGRKGFETYNYKVKFEYDGKEYISKSLESFTVSSGNVPGKNMYKQVTVYFKINNPEVVTIGEFDSVSIIGIVLLIFGLLTFFI